jgi:hypothetical protein
MLDQEEVPGDAVQYCSLRFDWAEADSHEKRLITLAALKRHTIELSEAVGYIKGGILQYETLTFPNPTLAR